MQRRPCVFIPEAAFAFHLIQQPRHIIKPRVQIEPATWREPYRRPFHALSKTLDALNPDIDLPCRHAGFDGVGQGFCAPLRT